MESQKPISPLRQRMTDDMRMRKLGEKTQYHYLHAVRQFAKYLGRSPTPPASRTCATTSYTSSITVFRRHR